MSSAETRYYLNRLRSRYLLIRGSEILLWSLAAGAFVFAILRIFFFSDLNVLIPLVATALTMIASIFALGLNRVKIDRIARYLNQKYPELEESADLLTKDPESLTSLQSLQRTKTARQLEQIYPNIRLPHNIGKAAFALSVAVLSVILLTSLQFGPIKRKTISPNQTQNNQSHSEVKLPASIKKISISITAPRYTGILSTSTENPELTIPEGSIVSWNIQYTDLIKKSQLVFPNMDTLVMKENGQYRASRKFNTPTFYQIKWQPQSGESKTSDYFKIQVVKDLAPEVTIPDFPQFTEFEITDKLTTTVTANIKDDYTVSDAWIIATVSKGSGESVKFREEKILFTTPANVRGKQVRASRILDLRKLGLEPGDELYFYAEAIDNRFPVPNRARTETYFISLKDTSSQNMSVEAGLGVDLMPDYFRSQRQIIIDTEKLIKRKKNKSISTFEFKSISNELGYDQKVLRLKYGEFLGEEFETQIGPGESGHDEQLSENQNITQQYGHVHDKDNEHNLVQDKKSVPDHHDHENKIDPQTGVEKAENPIDEYMHSHDSEEEATFFNQSIRSKLKAALSVMWDAELHLRLYDPETSLPFQYKALKLLKEVSNDSRVYVHKTGFDPPPLKEEKRLTADLSEIKNSAQRLDEIVPPTFPAIREGIARIELLMQKRDPALSSDDKKIFLSAGNELAALALEQPGKFLTALSQIKSLNESEVPAAKIRESLSILQKAFRHALPVRPLNAEPSTQTLHQLDRDFLKQLEKLKQ
jgi:hypothetical protein